MEDEAGLSDGLHIIDSRAVGSLENGDEGCLVRRSAIATLERVAEVPCGCESGGGTRRKRPWGTRGGRGIEGTLSAGDRAIDGGRDGGGIGSDIGIVVGIKDGL